MQSDSHARPGSAAPSSVPFSGPDALMGRLLDGRYRIGPRIARGGMATVYEATDLRLDRTVALKIMHASLGDAHDDAAGEFAARFVREARAAARLSHPNVVGVFDQGEDDGTVFLAMELVAGHTLRDTITTESPMAPGRALALLEPVLSALASAHRAGLIHRDVKPENVLIADDGRVKVADFGLAKAISADTQHTATGGVLIGTVSYLAPELVVDGRADARADVYAAGVMLYELLTGRKPHAGESPIAVAYKHVHEDVPPPSVLVPGLPPYVDALVARATARDRGQRPADAAVLLHQAHRVAHALAAGVRDDPDLVADLLPRAVVVEPDEVTTEQPRRSDTAPQPWDDAELAALSAPAPRPAEATTTVERAPAPRPVPKGRPTPPRTPDPAGTAPRRSRRGPLLLVLALLVAGGLGAGAWWFGYARYTTAPGVIGLTSAQAEQRLDAAGLDLEVGSRAYSDTVPAGRVIDTDPGAGGRVLDGGTVSLVLSRGVETYDLPDLRTMTEDQAQDALAATKLEFGRSTLRWSEEVPEGQVLGTSPKAGTTLRPGAVVDLVLSKGRKPRRVGAWVGEDADRAQRVLERRGLVVVRDQEVFSDDVAEGDVVSQAPEGGTLFRGETVTLVVSKGPELVEMPRVLASGVEAATERLEDLGFVVEVRNAAGYLGLGYVFSTDPDAGELVAKGSTVTLSVI